MYSREILFRIRTPFTKQINRKRYAGDVYDFVEITYIYVAIYKPFSVRIERQTYEDYWDK